jgi:hypothetical protein
MPALQSSQPRAEALLKELQQLLAASKSTASAPKENGLAWARADSKQLGSERKSHERRHSNEQRNAKGSERKSIEQNISLEADAVQGPGGGSSNLNSAGSWIQPSPVHGEDTEQQGPCGRWRSCLAGIPFRVSVAGILTCIYQI